MVVISGGRYKRSQAILVAIGVLFISACAGTAGLSGSSRMLLPPLQTETAEISLQQASVLAKDVDLLAINAEMKDFAEQHTANARTVPGGRLISTTILTPMVAQHKHLPVDRLTACHMPVSSYR